MNSILEESKPSHAAPEQGATEATCFTAEQGVHVGSRRGCAGIGDTSRAKLNKGCCSAYSVFVSCVSGVTRFRDVSHVDDLDVAFARATGLQFGRHGLVKTRCGESRSVQSGFGWLGAAVVRCGQDRLAISSFADVGSPVIAWGQEDLEVKQIVRVGSATETHFDCFAVDQVCVGDAQQSCIAFLSREVRHDQHVADAIAFQLIGLCLRSCCAQAEHRCSNARSKNTFFHEKLH